MKHDKCPTCGAPVTFEWQGLELVAESGDETLASKVYKYAQASTPPINDGVEDLRKTLNWLSQCVDSDHALEVSEIKSIWNDISDAISKIELPPQPVSAMEDVLNEIRQERTKQDVKWGEQNHAPADWLIILGEEVGEVNKAALEAKFGSSTLREYREELVQVAAVTVAMIECFDRNHLPPPPSK